MLGKRKKCTDRWEGNFQIPAMNSSETESEEEDWNECLKENADVNANIIEEIDFS